LNGNPKYRFIQTSFVRAQVFSQTNRKHEKHEKATKNFTTSQALQTKHKKRHQAQKHGQKPKPTEHILPVRELPHTNYTTNKLNPVHYIHSTMLVKKESS